MGVLNDLIIATEAELAALPEDDIPINAFPGVDIKGVGLIELASLHALLAGEEFDPSLDAFPMIGGQEDGPWLNRIPDEMLTRLASLSSDDVARFAKDWSATEEFQESMWEPEEVHGRLGEIVALAKRAVAAEKPIHLWTCL